MKMKFDLPEVTSSLVGLASAQVQLAMLLHRKGLIDKDEYSDLLEQLGKNFRENDKDERAAIIVEAIANSLRANPK